MHWLCQERYKHVICACHEPHLHCTTSNDRTVNHHSFAAPDPVPGRLVFVQINVSVGMHHRVSSRLHEQVMANESDYCDDRSRTDERAFIVNPAPSTRLPIDNTCRISKKSCLWRAKAHHDRYADPKQALRFMNIKGIKTFIQNYMKGHPSILSYADLEILYKYYLNDFPCPRRYSQISFGWSSRRPV